MPNRASTNPADLRAEIARAGLPIYQVAARLPINPTQLSRWLNGHDPIPHSAAQRVLDVLAEEQAQRPGRAGA